MLEVSMLKKSFKNKEVLKVVNFTIADGEIVCLLGKNGDGKTTIINSILKMIRPDSGFISLDGKDIYTYKAKEYFTLVSALLESSINVYNYLTAMENIDYFSGLLNKKIRPDYVNFLLDKFDIYEAREKIVGTYSLGMRQKLAIIISLLSSPKLLLLDEPTLGLDIESKLSIIEILKDMAKKNKISILLTTHQVDVVEKINGRVLLLKSGKIENFLLHDQKDKFLIKYRKGTEVISKEVAGDLLPNLKNIDSANLLEIKK